MREDFVIDNGRIVAYYGIDVDVVIPDGVTEIGEYVFSSFDDIKSVTLPTGVKVIGSHAFEQCRRLESVTLASGVEEICDSAFEGCHSLVGIKIPASVRYIGKTAFGNCYNLRTLELKGRRTRLGDEAFSGCPLVLDDYGYLIRNGILYYCDDMRPVTVIPEGVTEIAAYALADLHYCRRLVIPESLERIDELAICYHKNIVGTLRRGGFEEFELPQVCNPDRLNKLWKNSGEKHIREHLAVAIAEQYTAMVAQSKLWQGRIRGYTSKIAERALKNGRLDVLSMIISCCKSISAEEFDRWIELCQGNIEFTAFLLESKNERYSAARIEWQERVRLEKELGLRALTIADIKGLYSISYTDDGAVISAYKENKREVVVPEKIGRRTVTAIGSHTFAEKRSLCKITLPEGITKIGEMAFSGCINLSKITIPDSVTTIDAGAFNGCVSIVNLYIPETVTSISANAFIGCTNLILNVRAGSYAEQYARNQKLYYTVVQAALL